MRTYGRSEGAQMANAQMVNLITNREKYIWAVTAQNPPTSRKEKVQKTDRADSRKLARCLRSKEIEFIDIPSRELEADRALIRQRYRIVKDVSRTKNRIKSLLFEFGIDIPACFTDSQTRNWSKNYLRWLKELDIAEGSLKSTIDSVL